MHITSDCCDWKVVGFLTVLTLLIISASRCNYPMTDFQCSSNHLQESKAAEGRDVRSRYVFVRQAYDKFVLEKASNIARPDLVLALNCGFIFYKEWDPSMPALIKYPDVPLVFTEYYEQDCQLDLQKLGKRTRTTRNVFRIRILIPSNFI